MFVYFSIPVDQLVKVGIYVLSLEAIKMTFSLAKVIPKSEKQSNEMILIDIRYIIGIQSNTQ